MGIRLRLGTLLLPLSAFSAAALAQPAAATSSAAPLFDPAQLPGFEGKVERFTLTPRGDIDGFIFTDGTEVKTPPHLSKSIAYTVKLGDSVTVHGLRAAAIPLLQAVSVTDRNSGRSIVDTDTGPTGGPGVLPPPPPPRVPGSVEADGAIRMDLHGARGEVNGALLTDGTILRMPAEAAQTLAPLLQPGRTVIAQGSEVSNSIGKVVDVRQIGATRASLTWVGPSAPGPGGPPGAPGPRGALGPPPPPAAPPAPGRG